MSVLAVINSTWFAAIMPIFWVGLVFLTRYWRRVPAERRSAVTWLAVGGLLQALGFLLSQIADGRLHRSALGAAAGLLYVASVACFLVAAAKLAFLARRRRPGRSRA